MVLPIFILSLLPFLFLLRQVTAQAMLEYSLSRVLEKTAVWTVLLEQGENAASAVTSGEGEEGGDSGKSQSQETSQGNTQKASQDAALEAEWSSLRQVLQSAFDFVKTEGILQEIGLDIGGSVFLYSLWQEEITDEELVRWGVAGGWEGVSLEGSRFFFEQEGHHYLLRAEAHITWKEVTSFFTPAESTIVRVTHAFVGEEDGPCASEGQSEEEKVAETVYQIGNGICYHHADCFLIQKNVSSLSLADAKAKGLQACELCGGGDGGVVYVSSGGEKYHSKSCRVLFPNLTSMTLQEAQDAGLSPCGLCCSGQTYFQSGGD